MSKKKLDRRRYPDLGERLPYPIFDNHTHLPCKDGDDTEFQPAGGVLSIPEHVRRMQAVNVAGAITCACAVIDFAAHVQAAEENCPALGVALAVHPNEAPLHRGIVEKSPDGMTHQQRTWHQDYSLSQALELVAQFAKSKVVVAIGETGLDYYRTAASGAAAQKEAFRAHIALAKELDLPLQIHDREAHADCIEILRQDGAPSTTVFHCFSGDREMAEICAQEGWYCSFAGPLTYPANNELRVAIARLPKHLILLETDAPYLTAVPWRGFPNAPFAITHTAQAAAEVREIDLESFCKQIYGNTLQAYPRLVELIESTKAAELTESAGVVD